jgi:hypothetical protein
VAGGVRVELDALSRLDIVGRLQQPRAQRQSLLVRGGDEPLPWERPRDPAKLTPARVRRGFRRLRPTLGTPASAPKSDRPGPGRPKKTPHVHPEPGTQQSRKPHDTQTKVSSQA